MFLFYIFPERTNTNKVDASGDITSPNIHQPERRVSLEYILQVSMHWSKEDESCMRVDMSSEMSHENFPNSDIPVKRKQELHES